MGGFLEAVPRRYLLRIRRGLVFSHTLIHEDCISVRRLWLKWQTAQGVPFERPRTAGLRGARLLRRSRLGLQAPRREGAATITSNVDLFMGGWVLWNQADDLGSCATPISETTVAVCGSSMSSVTTSGLHKVRLSSENHHPPPPTIAL